VYAVFTRYIIIYIFCLNCGGVVRDVQKSWRLVSANDMWHVAAVACGPAFSYNMYIIMNDPQGWNFEYCVTRPPFRDIFTKHVLFSFLPSFYAFAWCYIIKSRFSNLPSPKLPICYKMSVYYAILYNMCLIRIYK